MPIRTNLKSLVPRRQAFKKRITLPSHGFTNPTAWPDGQINVYPWDSSIDDFLLDSSRKSSARQTTLFDLVEKLCDLNGASVDEFVADETNIVLLVARALAQDGTITYTSNCPFCTAKSEESIRVPDELSKVSEKKSDYCGFDVLTLPDSLDVIKVRPLVIKDERTVLERPAKDRLKISDNTLRTLLRIVNINDSTPDNLAELFTWFEALSPKDARDLEEKARELSPHLNTVIKHACANPMCGREFKHNLTFDQDFFR
jgi:hypothetical protein